MGHSVRGARYRRVIALVAATSIVVAACGGDDDDGDSASTTTPAQSSTATEPEATSAPASSEAPEATSAPETSATSDTADVADTTAAPATTTEVTEPPEPGDPIRIGVICTCSGPFGAAFKGGNDAFIAWSEHVNEKGGIDGHPIELLLRDDAMDPAKSNEMINELIGEDVPFLVNLSLLDVTWGDVLTQAQIPTIAGPTAGQNPYVFWTGMTPSTPESTLATVSVIQAAGVTKYGQMYCAESPICAEGVEPLRNALDEVGVEYAYGAAVAANAPDYTSQCIAAQQAGVDGMSAGGQPSTINHVASDCAVQGFMPTYIGSFTAWTKANEDTPGIGDRSYLSSANYPFFDDSLPEIATMNEAFDKYFPDLRESVDTPVGVSESLWAGGVLIERAYEESGHEGTEAPTAEEFLEGLYALDGETLRGLSVPLKFDQSINNINTCWFLAKWEDKTYTVLNDGEPTCA